MTIFDELIFDRTNEDLINDTDKAYISYIDLNRIENACKECAKFIGISIETKEWKITDFRTDEEMDRLLSNIRLLKENYWNNPNSPNLPSKITYNSIYQANDIEKILYSLEETRKSIINGQPRVAVTLGRKMIGNR